MPRFAAAVAFLVVLSVGGQARAQAPTAAQLGESGRARGWLLAQAEKYDLIKTKDGKVHTGKVLNETQRGYLFRSTDGATYVIDFEQIEEVLTAGPAGQSAPVAQPPPPMSAPPLMVPPPPPNPGGPSAVQQARIMELERELAEERDNSHSIGGPIFELILGLSLDLFVVAAGAGVFGSISSIEFLVVIVVAAISGTLFTVLGTIFLIRNIALNARRSGRINEIEEELLRLRQGYSQGEPALPLVVVARF